MMFFGRARAAGLSPSDAVEGAERGKVTVIDVREHGEVATTGKARGAVHIPLMRLPHMADPRHPDFLDVLKTDGKIAVYCATGARSSSALSLLRQLGYEDVHNIGGLRHWVKAGGTLERG